MEPTKSKTSLSSIIAVLALTLGLILTAGLSIFYWQVMSDLTEINRTTATLEKQNRALNQQLLDNITNLREEFQTQQAALTNLQQLSKGNPLTWRFAEAKYLVQLANYHLTFTRDVTAALALLQTAEQRIASLNDPVLQPLRQMMANNIAALQAVPKVDLAGLLTRITALQIQVNTLPAIGLPSAQQQPVDVAEEQAVLNQSPLRKAIHDSWVTLQKIVVIRHQDQQISPLLSPEQQAYLHQNLQLILQQAQWAALRGQEDIYQSSLQQARKWVERYFAKNLPATQAFLVALAELQKVNVQPPLPDLAPMARKIQQIAFNPSKQQDA